MNTGKSFQNVQTLVVGGEDFAPDLAETLLTRLADNVKIFNEYGPTEATVDASYIG